MVQRWFLSHKDLLGLTPLKARELIVKCFFTAQKEIFENARKKKGIPFTDEDIKTTVTAAIRSVFVQIGADFDNPTEESLLKVVETLTVYAKSWRTPQDIIDHHKTQIKKILAALKNTPTSPDGGYYKQEGED